MTTRELIQLLETFPADSRILIHTITGTCEMTAEDWTHPDYSSHNEAVLEVDL